MSIIVYASEAVQNKFWLTRTELETVWIWLHTRHVANPRGSVRVRAQARARSKVYYVIDEEHIVLALYNKEQSKSFFYEHITAPILLMKTKTDLTNRSAYSKPNPKLRVCYMPTSYSILSEATGPSCKKKDSRSEPGHWLIVYVCSISLSINLYISACAMVL